MRTVLIVDDERRIHAFLTRALSGQGYRVLSALDGRSALEHLRSFPVDLVLLDLLLGGDHGLVVLGEMRHQHSDVPVIVISAVTDVPTRVSALNRGAIDVVAKPFNVAELVARIRRHLPRRPSDRDPARYVDAGGLRLDTARRTVETSRGTVTLTEREAGMLEHLMRHAGDVCSRAAIFRDVWGFDVEPDSNLVAVAVGRLRAKIPDLPVGTVRGVGYLFELGRAGRGPVEPTRRTAEWASPVSSTC